MKTLKIVLLVAATALIPLLTPRAAAAQSHCGDLIYQTGINSDGPPGAPDGDCSESLPIIGSIVASALAVGLVLLLAVASLAKGAPPGGAVEGLSEAEAARARAIAEGRVVPFGPVPLGPSNVADNVPTAPRGPDVTIGNTSKSTVVIDGKNHVGGDPFMNSESRFPSVTASDTPISYKEYDVHPYTGANRGLERVVIGSNGTRYYTKDHYGSFTQF